MSQGRLVYALFVRCLALGCVAALPVAFSIWIDPARIVGARRDERAIALALVAGHDVTNVMNYDDRSIERMLAEQRPGRPDVLAIGSSRIQALSASAFPGKRFVNAGLSGAHLHEMVGMAGLYDGAAKRPSRVVIDLDPWSLGDDRSNETSTALLENDAAMSVRLGVPTSVWRERIETWLRRIKRVASPEYFRLSVFSLRTYGPNGIRYVVTDRPDNAEKTKTPDGSLVWSRTTPDKTEALARAYIADNMRGGAIPYDGEPSHVRVVLLEGLLRHLHDEGVQVTVLLVPFHPLVFDAFTQRSPNVLLTWEARYRALALRAGAEVAGGYSPVATGMNALDFFDASHMRAEALERLVLLTDQRTCCAK